jgi:hypothetical protein
LAQRQRLRTVCPLVRGRHFAVPLHYTNHFKLRCRTPKASASSSSPDAQRPLPLPWSVLCGDYLNTAPVKNRELNFSIKRTEEAEAVGREKADASYAYLLQVQRCLSRNRALRMRMHLHLQDTDSADSRTCIWTTNGQRRRTSLSCPLLPYPYSPTAGSELDEAKSVC